MAASAASSAIGVDKTMNALALPERGGKTLSVTVGVDRKGRFWTGVREMAQAARGNCNLSTAGDVLRKMLAQEDSVKRAALLTALGGSETRAHFPGWGQQGLVCQVKCVAAVLDATASNATTPDQRKDTVGCPTRGVRGAPGASQCSPTVACAQGRGARDGLHRRPKVVLRFDQIYLRHLSLEYAILRV